MACELCGAHAPTKHVTISQNIGLVILRFYSAAQGQLCRRCIGSEFWRRTLITIFLGPWGLISLIFSPIIVAGNIGNYVGALAMPTEGPPGPWIPTEDEKRRGMYYKLAAVALVLSPVFLFCLLMGTVMVLQQMGIIPRQ